MAALTVVVAYDVREDGDRAKIAALLQVHGNRLQKSVFLLNVDEEELRELMERIGPFLDHGVDRLLVARQCKSCWEQAEFLGQADSQPSSLCWTVM